MLDTAPQFTWLQQKPLDVCQFIMMRVINFMQKLTMNWTVPF
jgi:hypothetical protein